MKAHDELLTRDPIGSLHDALNHVIMRLAAFSGLMMESMTRGRFRHLPVVRHGELLGLVSIGDVVKWRLEETQHEAEALKAYIVAG